MRIDKDALAATLRIFAIDLAQPFLAVWVVAEQGAERFEIEKAFEIGDQLLHLVLQAFEGRCHAVEHGVAAKVRRDRRAQDHPHGGASRKVRSLCHRSVRHGELSS